MKIGFLLNITLLLCFVCSYLLLWLIDGTLVRNLVLLFDGNSSFLDPEQYSSKQPNKASRKPKKHSSPYPFKLVETTHAPGDHRQTHQKRYQNAKQTDQADTFGEPQQSFAQNVYVAHQMDLQPDEDL